MINLLYLERMETMNLIVANDRSAFKRSPIISPTSLFYCYNLNTAKIHIVTSIKRSISNALFLNF